MLRICLWQENESDLQKLIAMIILFLRFGLAFDSEAAVFCDFFSVILGKDDL